MLGWHARRRIFSEGYIASPTHIHMLLPPSVISNPLIFISSFISVNVTFVMFLFFISVLCAAFLGIIRKRRLHGALFSLGIDVYFVSVFRVIKEKIDK